jgi:nucleoside-diphosphate-sugar epimerase
LNILVIGATGFVGRHLKARLLTLGHEVIDGTRNYHFVPDLMLDEPAVDAIINCAGEITHPHLMYAANVALVEKILRFARDAKIPKVIHCGSSSEYGATTAPRCEDTPCVATDLYSATKIAATALCQGFAKQHGLDVCIARPFSLYGSGDTPRKLIPRLIQSTMIKDTIVSVYADGSHDWLHIDDFCDGLVTLLDAPREKTQGDIVNFGTCVASTNRQVVLILTALGCTPLVTLTEQPPTVGCLNTSRWVADTTKAREKYGWTAKTSLEEGLHKIIALS